MKKIICLLFSCFLVACSATKAGLEKYDGQSDGTIFEGADKSLLKGDYKDASERYEALQTLFPYGDYTQQSGLNVLYTYYSEREYDSLDMAADRYIRFYPQGPHTDYAYYMKALGAFSRGKGFFERFFDTDTSGRQTQTVKKSFDDFNEFLTRYSNSVYAPDARKRMVYLRNMLAKHEYDIADYYYQRKAYVGAAERAKGVVDEYQNSVWVADALVIMVNSYTKLGLSQSAERAKAVLAANYPEKLKKIVK